MAYDEPWKLSEDGYLNVDTDSDSIIYHPNLNIILVSTKSSEVHVIDVNSGVILQKSSLSGCKKGVLRGTYLVGHDKILFTDGKGIGVRRDYNGVMLLDTILQTPISRSDDFVKLELLLSEAILLQQCLKCVDLPGVENVADIQLELAKKIKDGQEKPKTGTKAQKWNSICLEVAHCSLKQVCAGMVQELKRQNRHIPALSIASAINERLGCLLPSASDECIPTDRSQMFSEAARIDTFVKWPHMHYKWALPAQMAQAGFYHQPNATGDDRAMCFTCNVCLVCWEPTDEPWSEHERHSPSCPFVKGEYTQNVPLSVSFATSPAATLGVDADAVAAVGASSVTDLVAVATQRGHVVVWNVARQLKRDVSFVVSAAEVCRRARDDKQRDVWPRGWSHVAPPVAADNADNAVADADTGPLAQHEFPCAEGVVRVDSVCVVGCPTPATGPAPRPCLVAGLSAPAGPLTGPEMAWGGGGCSPMVLAMNDVNEQSNRQTAALDIMSAGCAKSGESPRAALYLVVYDFHYASDADAGAKDAMESGRRRAKHKSGTGTGTSAAASHARNEANNMYQEMFLSKFLYDGAGMDDATDGDVVMAGTHADHQDCLDVIDFGPMPSSSAGSYPLPFCASTSGGVTFDSSAASFSALNGCADFPSTSESAKTGGCSSARPAEKSNAEAAEDARRCPCAVQAVALPRDLGAALTVSALHPTRDGAHLLVLLGPPPDSAPAPGLALVFALDVTTEVVRLGDSPVAARKLSAGECPVDVVLLPLAERENTERDSAPGAKPSWLLDADGGNGAWGRAAFVGRDGAVRVVDLATLRTTAVAAPRDPDNKFVSAAFCNSLERLCACTAAGSLHFFPLSDAESTQDGAGRPDVEEAESARTPRSDWPSSVEPSPATSAAQSPTASCHAGECRLAVDCPAPRLAELLELHELTRHENLTPLFAAAVPPCWTEMMQAQKQRRHPQHLQQGEEPQHTRSWRLQNDATTWDEHVFELTLPRSCSVGHLDVKFSLHAPCPSPPNVQVTLLKQNANGIGRKEPFGAAAVDQPVAFGLAGTPGPTENPVTTQEYLRDHNTEILCGPVNLSACLDLSDTGGSVTLTSPKLFAARGRTLLVHIKAVSDEAAKHENNCGGSKPRTSNGEGTASKRSKLDSLFSMPALDRSCVNAVAAKKMEYYLGCDWLHEVSITIRKTKQTSVPHDSLQRSVLLESDAVAERLLTAACSLPSAAQGVALDVLVWVASVRLARNRSNRPEVRAQQLEFARIVERHLPALVERCVLLAGRSNAHKCVKLVVVCSEGVKNATDGGASTRWDSSVLRALLDRLPALPRAKSAGALRWFLLLLGRAMAVDVGAAAGQKCLALLQQVASELSSRFEDNEIQMLMEQNVAQVASELSSRSSPEHLLLRTRFGLYGTPLEPELFDVEPPVSGKATSVPVTYATVAGSNDAGGGVAICTAGPSGAGHVAEAEPLDLRELLNVPVGLAGMVDALKGVPARLKGLSAGHFMKGLLEVEPLHFTCHAASDGTKMEKVEPGAQTQPPANGNFFDPANFVTTNAAKNADSSFAELAALKALVGAHKSKPSTVIVELDKGKHSDTSSSSSQQSTVSGPAVFLSSTAETVAAPTQAAQPPQIAAHEDAKEVGLPWQLLLVPQPQHMVVIERMHSGARRFVVMDLGGPVLLTDLLIPSCSDLVSLSVDIWLRGEEVDGQRLVVAADIGTKSLVMSDLQPPPICRFVKITTIGRYGMSTTRCRIPIGSFFGHLVVLPGESYDSPAPSGCDPPALDCQLTALAWLLEDVHCRYSLACAKLRELLAPLLAEEIPNAAHMHHFLARPTDTERTPGADKVHSAYQECVTFQRQLNLVRNAMRRLESWSWPPDLESTAEADTGQLLQAACTDKLRVLGEGLLDTLLYLAHGIGPVPRLPAALFHALDMTACRRLFAWLCVREDTRMQLGTCTLLVRMCGLQPWWGDFLADTLATLFASTAARDVSPQDRVFLLLTYLGRKSLASGAPRALVLDSALAALARLLADNGASGGFLRAHMDLSLIGWMLLFLSVCLDTPAPGTTQPSEQDKTKESQGGGTSRWDFIQGEVAMQKRLATTHRSNASRSYRRKLQKRLMHHKQQLEDLEAAKKAFHASTQALSALSSQAASLSNKLEAALKQHEQVFKKTLKQHSAKHFKDILQIRRTETPGLSPKTSTSGPSTSGASTSRHGTPPKEESPAETGLLCLPLDHCLPVAKGLLALVLSMDFTCNVDMFLLACKVIARLVVSTRPAIALDQLMTQEQLLRLLRLAACNDQHKASWGGPWASHAVCCLLQDLLDGARTFPPPRNEDTTDCSCQTETDETPSEEYNAPNADAVDAAGGSFQLQSLLESEDSELEDFLDDILERGRNLLKRGNVGRAAVSASAAVSTAMDARLEYGVDAAAEVTLKRLTALGAYNLPLSVGAAIVPPPDSALQPSESSWPSELTESCPVAPVAGEAHRMLATAFHTLFAELHSSQGCTGLEPGLQLWLTLSADSHEVALGPCAASGLLAALAWRPGVSLRAWTLAFRALAQMATPRDGEDIVNDRHFVPALLRFLSGAGVGAKGCVGPSCCQALSDLLSCLSARSQTQDADLRRALLSLASSLAHPAGAMAARQGPLDAQCRLLDAMNAADFHDVDANVALGLVDAIAALAQSYIAGLHRARCRTSTEPSVSSTACFGGLFASVLGGGGVRAKTATRDSLVAAMLHLANKLARQSVNRTDGMDLDCQTEAGSVAELVLAQESTMLRLLGALSSCSGSSLAMLLGTTTPPEQLAVGEVGEPLTVGDAVFQLLSTLAKKASEPRQMLRPLLSFLSAETAPGAVQLSEPLLWLSLRVLDSARALSDFAALGGVATVGKQLVAGSVSLVNAHPGLVSVVMQHLSHAPTGMPGTSKKLGGVELCEGLLNFAPLGTISSSNPTAQPADVLIASAPPHRRARTPAWSYHFYPDEEFVELKVALPCAVLLKQVHLQPHLQALATCPAAVALEVGRDAVMAPVCTPLNTSGLTFIRIALPQPEVVTAVLLRLYKPRDSVNLGLSQIRLLGSTAFGETTVPRGVGPDTPEDVQPAKSSLGWLRLLHHCVSIPAPTELADAVLDAAAAVPRLLEACCGLLLIPGPAPAAFAPSLERVLLKLGLRSRELGLAQLQALLTNSAAAFAQGSVAAVDSAVELVFRLCSAQDAWTGARVEAVLRWLRQTAAAETAPPCAAFVRAAAAVVWDAAEDPHRCYDLRALITEDLFTALCDWTQSLPPHSALKKAVDSVVCASCRAVPALFARLLPFADPAALCPGRLGTLAAAAQSDAAVDVLLASGATARLAQFVAESCGGGGEAAELAAVMDFFAEVCAEGRVRDWLGSEQGSVFWLPLLTALCNKSSAPAAPESHAALESATVRFLSRCCWCHPSNQRLASRALCSVIGAQRSRGISGFTRRLVLQLLLEDEKIFVFVRASFPLAGAGAAGSFHPRFGVGHRRRLVYLSTQTTCADILKCCAPVPTSLSADARGPDACPGRKEPWELGLGLVDQLALAAGATAKDKRAKDAKNAAARPAPYAKRPRASADISPSMPGFTLGASMSLALASAPDVPLPPALALGQLLAHELAQGRSLSSPCLALALTQSAKNGANAAQDGASTSSSQASRLTSAPFLPTPLQVFSEAGGLALLARHLPLVYPETLRYTSDKPSTAGGSPTEPSCAGAEAEWVKVEAAEDMYEELDDGAAPSSPPPAVPPPSVPPHALAAFGLFLRLPGYATVLLGDRKKAQCLLRLVLGVTDDGEGGDILSLPLAGSLHTLPFCVLRQLFDSTPLGSEVGAALRRATVDVGAMHLLLGCLAVFTHQTQDLSLPSGTGVAEVALAGKPAQGSERREDKPAQPGQGHLYWAKGTGFGTGSTAQSWNVEQALMRQRSEEEHVTVLLQVISCFMNPGNAKPPRFLSADDSSSDDDDDEADETAPAPPADPWLPPGFVELAERSCLLPAVSSYLRNDSVLDMARHIPLYRAVLQLLRAMAYDSRLAALLLPSDSQANRSWRGDELSVVCLLTKMKACVDTYASRLRANKGKGGGKSRAPTKFTEELESDEGLALFIFDIQETANLVQLATERLVLEDDVDGEDVRPPTESPLRRSLEDRYLEVMKRLQFDSFEMITESAEAADGFQFVVAYHFESSLRAAGERCHPSRVKRLAQEAVTLSTSLPLSYSSSVFVRCDTDRLDIMKVLMTGPAETPYANGCFEFDVYFPPDYPNAPMMINLETTGHHTIRFNPNLYNDGKVCLSVLNTWHGRPEEKWNAATSSFLQVLVSIQSLILVPEPYFNEPGYERSRGTPSGNQSSREYNSNICQATVKWAMLEQVRSPCPCFKDVIHTHFWMKRHEIVAQVESWIAEMESQSGDRRAGRAISLNAMALKRHFRQLREELAKLTPPEGLADLADAVPEVADPAPPPAAPAAPVAHDDADIDMEMEKMVSKVCE